MISSLEALSPWLSPGLYQWIARDSWCSKRDQWLDLSITLVLWKTCSAIILVWLDFASSSGYTPVGSQSSCHSEMHGEWWRDSSSCLKWSSFTFVISNKNGCRHHSLSILYDITYKLSNKLKYIKKQRVREKNVQNEAD